VPVLPCLSALTHLLMLLLALPPLQAIFVKRSSVGEAATADASTSAPVKKQQTKLSALWGAKKESSVEPSETAEASSSSGDVVAQLERVSYDFEDEGQKQFHGEGRTITLELDSFFLVACYVPNAGEGLVRLNYRVDEWEVHTRAYLQALSERKPVVYTGDLNVGHLDLDIHNPLSKKIDTVPGLTPRERGAFSQMLAQTGFRDAFRELYPDAQGQFTQWSQRTNGRPFNRGLRLDYFVCSSSMFAGSGAGAELEAGAVAGVGAGSGAESGAAESQGTDDGAEEAAVAPAPVEERVLPAPAVDYAALPSPGVYDSYILHADTVGCSDHCPILLVVKM
jgi:exodeoxyribonuclease III